MTQCSMSEIGDMALYNSCSLLIQVITGPLPGPSKCKSGRFKMPMVMKTKFPATVMVFGIVSSEGHIMPPHVYEVGLKVNTKVYLDVLKCVVTLYPSLTSHQLLPRPEPAGLLRLVIRREHHQYGLPQHQSQPDRHHLPSICLAPTSACGKGMFPVPDPYRGSDWGWRRLHWIALLHNQVIWIDFFQ